MAHRTIERRLTYCCLSALCLQITSAFVAPTPYAEVPSRTLLFSTTHEAASVADESKNPTAATGRMGMETDELATEYEKIEADFADYIAPLNEIERRRNLAIISHPDSGEYNPSRALE
jgi:hypothetical protein